MQKKAAVITFSSPEKNKAAVIPVTAMAGAR